MVAMEPYRRPARQPVEFRDAGGKVIHYGERWGTDGPPENAYSVLSHPERFQPLHDAARALIAHLDVNYEVEVSEDPALLEHVPRGISAITAVSVTPADNKAAPLTLVFTDLPGIVLMAGAFLVEPLPACGCDACDDSAASVADDLEWMVFAVVEGGLTEKVTRGPRASIGHRLERSDGWRGGEGRAGTQTTRGELSDGRTRLAQIGGAWAAWPRRVAVEPRHSV